MKCRMFALSLALGALLCLAPSAAALENQPEVPAPDTAAASQTDTPAAPAEEAAPALTEEVTKEVTVTVEVPILPEKPPIQISYTTPEEIGFTWEEDGLELEVAEVLPVEEISLAPDRLIPPASCRIHPLYQSQFHLQNDFDNKRHHLHNHQDLTLIFSWRGQFLYH